MSIWGSKGLCDYPKVATPGDPGFGIRTGFEGRGKKLGFTLSRIRILDRKGSRFSQLDPLCRPFTITRSSIPNPTGHLTRARARSWQCVPPRRRGSGIVLDLRHDLHRTALTWQEITGG